MKYDWFWMQEQRQYICQDFILKSSVQEMKLTGQGSCKNISALMYLV
jgi:hypothetical protein